MSLTKPDKYDDLARNIAIYKEFLSDPKIRCNVEIVKYFAELTEKTFKIYKKLAKEKKNV